MANDEGFEFCSPRLKELYGWQGLEDEEIDLDEENYDSFTDKIRMPDAIKFASYTGPPNVDGHYVGFAPDE